MITVTTWPRADMPYRGREYTICEEDLFCWLARPFPARSKADLPGYSLASYHRQYRCGPNLIAVYGIGVDGDGGATFAEGVDTWAPFYGYAYTTPSSTLEAQRWRAILLLAQPMTDVQDVKRVIRWAQRRSPGKIDTGTCDPCRLWYPSLGGAKHWEHAGLIGKPLDGHKIANEEREREERERVARHVERALRAAKQPKKTDGTSYADRALARACEAVATAHEGDRHKMLAREAFSIGTLVATGALTRDTAYSALDAASRIVFPDSREDERVRTLSQQLAEGEKNPRTA